jgi:hypothetical protein
MFQAELERESQNSHSPVEGGVTSSSQTPPLVEEEVPIQNTRKSEKKIWSRVPTGTETKDCADKGQHQFY